MRHTMPMIVAAIVSLMACQPTVQELTETERDAIAGAVEAQLSEFWDAWAATDYEAGMTFYDDHADFALVFESDAWMSRNDLDAAMRPMFATISSQSLNQVTRQIAVLSRDVVTVTQTGTFTQTSTDGAVTPELPIATTTVWVLRDGEWKVRVAHMSQGPEAN